MKAFGYVKNSETLLALTEVTLKCTHEELDIVIEFLQSAKRTMEMHGELFGHEHMKDWLKKSNLAIDFDSDLIIAR